LPRHLNRQAKCRKVTLFLKKKLHRNYPLNYLLRPKGAHVVGQPKPQARNRNPLLLLPKEARLA
jgi:hypothetical protein